MTKEETVPAPLLPFWSDRKKKSRSIFLMAIAVFIGTLPHSIVSIFVLPLMLFPTGLISLVVDKADYSAIYWSAPPFDILTPALVSLVWIFYIGMAKAIVRSNNRKVVTWLYLILGLLLILNVVGCQITGPVVQDEF